MNETVANAMLPLDLIDKVALGHGLKAPYSISLQEGEKGNNYLGVIEAVTIKAPNQTLNLIVKTAPRSEKVRGTRAIIPAFKREIEMYNHVLPEFFKFQKARALPSPFLGAPRFYAGTLQHCSETLILENMVPKGYKLHNPLEPMDFEHMALVVEEYAKLHSLSLALRDEEFQNLTKNICLNFLDERKAKNPAHYTHQMEVVLDMGDRALAGSAKALEAHKRFKNVFPRYWGESQEIQEKDLVVVTHGDCNANNILFKYDPDLRPQKVCLIDWQLSSVRSPVHDLSFALYACASKEALLRTDELFRIYLSVIAQNLGPKKLDYETFLSHWKKHFIYGLYRAQANLKLSLTTQKETSELSILDIIKMDFEPDSRFACRMRDVFEVLSDQWL